LSSIPLDTLVTLYIVGQSLHRCKNPFKPGQGTTHSTTITKEDTHTELNIMESKLGLSAFHAIQPASVSGLFYNSRSSHGTLWFWHDVTNAVHSKNGAAAVPRCLVGKYQNCNKNGQYNIIVNPLKGRDVSHLYFAIQV